MAIKISNEPIINDDRFIVSPTIQRITGTKTFARGYNYRTVSSCIMVENDSYLIIQPLGIVGGVKKIEGASLTIGDGAETRLQTNEYF